MTATFWAGEQKITSEQNLSVLGDAAQRRAQICAQQALHQSPCEETLLALDDARGHLKSVALAALAVDRLRRRGLLMRQRRERAHASYTARKNKLEKAERADEAAAEIECPRTTRLTQNAQPCPWRCPPSRCGPRPSTIRWGAAIETDLGAARPRSRRSAVWRRVRPNSRRPPRHRRDACLAPTHCDFRRRTLVTEVGVFASEVAAFLDRFNVVRAAVR